MCIRDRHRPVEQPLSDLSENGQRAFCLRASFRKAALRLRPLYRLKPALSAVPEPKAIWGRAKYSAGLLFSSAAGGRDRHTGGAKAPGRVIQPSGNPQKAERRVCIGGGCLLQGSFHLCQTSSAVAGQQGNSAPAVKQPCASDRFVCKAGGNFQSPYLLSGKYFCLRKTCRSDTGT